MAGMNMCVYEVASVVSDSGTLWTVAHKVPLSMGFFRQKIPEWVAKPFSSWSSQPRDWTQVSQVLYHQRHLGSPGMNILLLLLLNRFSRVWLCATPYTAAHQAPPSLGFYRQEHWSGLPLPSPTHEKWEVKVKSLSHVDSSQSHGLQPTSLLCPWDFTGKSTGVGCHCLLQIWTWEGVKTFKACTANRWVRQDLPHSRCLLSDMLRCTGVTASL